MADTTVKIKAEISQLKAQMQQAARSVKLANSEFKAATAGMDDWSQSAKGLQAKLKQLDSTLGAQKKQLSLMEKELEKTEEAYGKNSAAADRVRMAINNQKAAISKTEKQIDQYNGELQKAEKYGDNFADTLDEMDEASSQASDGFTVMKGALANLVADGIQMAIGALKDLISDTIEVGQTFEKSMSNVQALSGATAEEMKLLSDTAKEFGASTQFSASEAADALGYMALAGWDAQTSADALGGVLDLAAASGMELAEASDMVTDYMSAFGMEAKESAYFADLLAYAQANANTTAAGLGEAFKNSAANMNAAGQDIETVTSLISMMANQGLKGSEAGTALTAVMRDMTNKMEDGAISIGDTSVAIQDASGNYRDLTDILKDIEKATDGLGDAEKASALSATFTSDSIKGLNLILNAGVENAESFEAELRNCSGSASEMAKTMNDNLAGDLTALNSKIEGTKITVYESLTPALRDAVAKISEVIDTIDWDKVGKKLGDFAVKAVNFGAKIIDNADGIISVLKTIGTVLGITFVVTKIISFAQGISTLYTTFKTLKTATDAATTSQLLLNAAQAATPIGLVTAAVAGLAAGVLYLISKTDEEAQSTQILTEYEQEQIDKVYELKGAYDEMIAARNETVAGVNSEFEHYNELSTELDSLVDANGRVKEGYEERANFILTTLNEACGTEMQLVDGVIENYKEEKATLDKLLETKKAEAILRANEELYTNAIKDKDTALKNLTSAQGIYKQNVSDLSSAEKEYNKIMNMTAEEYAEQNDLTYDLGTAAQQLKNDQEELGQKFLEAKAAVGQSRVAMETAQQTYDDYMSTIQNYEGLSSAIISGDADKIEVALNNMQNNFKTTETATRSSLEKQVEDYKQNVQALETAISNGTPGVTQKMLEQARSMLKAAEGELAKAPASIAEKANEIPTQYAAQLSSPTNQALLKSDAEEMKNTVTEGLQPDGENEEAGENYILGYSDSILNSQQSVVDAVNTIGQSSTDTLNDSIGARSPSRITTQSGEYFGQGFVNGINNKQNAVWTAALNLARKAIDALKAGQKEGSPSKLTYQSGVYFVQGYINGISSQNKQLQNTAKNMVKVVVSELGKMANYNFDFVAENASSKFGAALSKKIEYMLGRMQYVNDEKLSTFDTTIDRYEDKKEKSSTKIQTASDKRIDKYEAQRDKAVKAIEKARDRDIKSLEAENKRQVSEFEKMRDNRIKQVEKDRDRQIKSLERNRDLTLKEIEKNKNSKIKSLEKERDKKINDLQSRLDNLSYSKENSAERKNLQRQIQNARESYNKQIQAAKNNATKQSNAIKNSTSKQIKQENKEASWLISEEKKNTSKSIKEQKENSSKIIKSVKENASKQIKEKNSESKKQIDEEKKNAKKEIKASDDKYDKLISEENKKKEAYQKASSEMMAAYSNAMQEYQTKAQELIDNTINGITEKYNQRYDELIGKQDNLIDKLKSAGDLFNVSNAGVMTVNDLKEQTKAIKTYTDKLQKIKAKVSSELFDQIVSYDMKEGSAFMDRLLALSAKDLESYNKAYSEKMQAAEKAGENIYGSDIKKVADDYEKEINKAFNDLPKKLEELGKQTMSGFLSGLTSDTDYMSKEIKTYINAMIDTFKKELKIKSPSRVMMEIGDYTGTGLVDGLKKKISDVKKTASEMVTAMANPLDEMKTSFGDIKAVTANQNGVGATNNNVVNNYNLVQNNTSPKSLSALETYQARRQQIAMVKALL